MFSSNPESARDKMLRKHLRPRGIVDRRVLAAMGKVPRERFLPDYLRNEAYADRALSIDCGQTISQPFIVALMTQALELSGRETVLEIGTGSGYQAAILAELAREVITIERYASLSQQASVVLESLDYENVTCRIADGTLGCPEKAPFDRIIVTAAAVEYPPPLFDQLAEGGILAIPLGGRDYQTLQAIHKTDGRPQMVNLSACRFVPLVGAQAWPN